MRLAVITQYDEVIREYGELSAENKRCYSNLHGYELLCHRGNLALPRPAAWSKIPLILRHLDDFDWLFWTDADSLVMNSYLQAGAPHAKFVPGDFIVHLAGWRDVRRVATTIRGLLRRAPCELTDDARAWTRSLATELLDLLPGDMMLERTLARNL
jgi:hypothetical protein